MSRRKNPSAATVRLVGFMALIALVFELAPVAPAMAQSAIRILVNDDPITSYDIQSRTQMLRVFSRGQEGEKKAIEQLIDEKLMLQEAKRRNVEIDEAQLDEEYAKRAASARMSVPQFTQALRQAGINSQTFKDFIRANTAWGEIVRARFRAQVKVTEQDVAAALTNAETPEEAKQAVASEYMLQPIIFVVSANAPNGAEARQRSAANAFRQTFQGCDQSLQQVGGKQGVVVKPTVRREEGQLSEKLRQALAALEVGGITEPERVEEGYQLLGVCAKNAIAGHTQATEEVRQELTEERGALLARRYLRDLRSDAVIEYR